MVKSNRRFHWIAMAMMVAIGVANPVARAESGPATQPGTQGQPGPSPHQWTRIDEGKTGERAGAMLMFAADLKQMLLVGPAKGGSFVQAYDLAEKNWTELSKTGPGGKDGNFHNYYQTAYDPAGHCVYCLSGGQVLHVFNVAEKTWKELPPAAELEGLSWLAMACDPAGRKLVVVGADKKPDNLGWARTVVYDIAAGAWRRLDVADAKVVAAHKELVAAKEATIDLVGRLRSAWYRDPAGVGSPDDLKQLADRCAALGKLPQMNRFAAAVDGVAALLADRKTLDSLAAARALVRKIEEAAEAQYPVPCSRRNSPLAFDAKNGLFVLFGGDHEDYMMNDTWVLDLSVAAGVWRRSGCDVAPSPRAGHALVGLPKSGRVALYEGYVQDSNTDYGCGPCVTINPVQLWLFDAKADRWDLAGLWPAPPRGEAAIGPRGSFYGYANECFSPPALAADSDDTLVFAANQTTGFGSRWPRPSETFTMSIAPARTDPTGREKLGGTPNGRRYRTGIWLAANEEVPDAPKPLGLDSLPDNTWVKLPGPPRNPCSDCRARTWGTSVWDSDRDQILIWGGGHCIRSASTVAHWSPASGRIVEGYDADEPYSRNGGGGYGSSLLNRPWVSVHSYSGYAYDPKCKLLVSGRGFLYDPDRMDWVRAEPIETPFRFSWGGTVVKGSPHGAVAWSQAKKGETIGLWLFDRDTGWVDLEPKGQLFGPYCDASGMVYDSKRDRMIFGGAGGGYARKANGTLVTFDFKTRAVETITPANSELAKTDNARELAYVEHADWMLIGEGLVVGDPKTGKQYTRIYDCQKNRVALLDAGPVPGPTYNFGWMYDAKRKLVYAMNDVGQVWALKLEPKTATLLDKSAE